jgi:hypothetical protein
MQSAYGLQDFQVVGGPRWIDSDGYNIEAKAEGSASKSQSLAHVAIALRGPAWIFLAAKPSSGPLRTRACYSFAAFTRLPYSKKDSARTLSFFRQLWRECGPAFSLQGAATPFVIRRRPGGAGTSPPLASHGSHRRGMTAPAAQNPRVPAIAGNH